MFMARTEMLKKRKTTRLQDADYSSAGLYFITICTKDRRCLLSRVLEGNASDGPLLELLPYGTIAEQYIRQLNDFYHDISVEEYVIMPNHIHLLLFVEPKESADLEKNLLQNSIVSRFISTFKRFCNKEIGYNIWQFRSYDHIIRNFEDYQTHLKYICENPMYWKKDTLYFKDSHESLVKNRYSY